MIDSEGLEKDRLHRRNRKVGINMSVHIGRIVGGGRYEGKKGRQWQEVSAIYYKLQRMYAGAKNSLHKSIQWTG